jgi:putative ABC transport system permease protein
MQSLLQDLRFAIREMRKSFGFALTAILTFTIGIGGVTAVFSIVAAVLLRPLPFEDSGRLISLHERVQPDTHELRMTAPDVLTFERENRAFSGVAGFTSSTYELTGAGLPFMARVERVTASLFPVLGVQPGLGRTFTQQEDDSATPVTVISYTLWEQRFQSDQNILGRTVDLDRRPYTIIGVMPRNFEFPLDAGRLSQRDLWIPMSFTPLEKNSEGNNFDYGAVARLRPGVTLQQAQQDVDRVIASIQDQYPPDRHIQLSGYFLALKDEVVQKARPLMRILLVAVGLILLIACVNVANLLLVRAAGRKREFATRLCLGATYPAILRQLITESLILSSLGGLGGAALAIVLVRASAASLPDSLPRLPEIGVSWQMLLVAAVLVCATGLLCGLVPAFESIRPDVLGSLQDGSYGSAPGRSRHRMRSALVVVEVALSMFLLVASGLLLRSFGKMLTVEPGFEPTHALTASLSLPLHDYPTQQKVNDFLVDLQRRLEAVPEVKSFGAGSNIPIVGQNSGRLIAPEGYVKAPGEGWIIASNYLVQGNYFDAMGIPLVRGRFFGAGDDRPGAPLVIVIGESLAKRYFEGKNPIGMRIKIGPSFSSPMPAMTVVGVVGDIKPSGFDQPTVPELYEPLSQAAADLGPMGGMIGVVGNVYVVVRSGGDPGPLGIAVSDAVRSRDPLLAVTHMHTMDEVIAATGSSRRFNTTILTVFATIALLLSLLGLYGTMAYSVTERSREIAIRMALGATRGNVLLRALSRAIMLTAAGVAAGLAASAGLTHLLISLLYGVSPLDGVAIASAVGVLLACAPLAAWLPARRAASVEPMQLLRLQ